jgi:hypothetical protein
MCGENRYLLPVTLLTLANVSSWVVFDNDGMFRPYVVPSQRIFVTAGRSSG